MTVCIPSTAVWPAGKWDDATDEELAQRDLSEVFAWRSLTALTGYRLSICPVEVRPARASCRPETYYVSPVTGFGAFHPYIGLDGLWRNEAHAPGCTCDSAIVVTLPGPIARIDAVIVDGDQLPADAYHVEFGNKLVRDDGGTWPLTQSLKTPPTDTSGFYVRMYLGEAPDETADYVAGVLANEFLLGIAGNKKCRLPSNVTVVSRQGISYNAITSFFEAGLTGIPEVDAYVAWMNPAHMKSPAQAWSVDTIDRASFRSATPLPEPVFVPGGLVEDPSNPGYYIYQPPSMTTDTGTTSNTTAFSLGN